MKKIHLTIIIFNLLFNTCFAQADLDPLSFSFDGHVNGLNPSGYVTTGIKNGATLTTDQFGRADKAYYFDGKSNIRVNYNNPPSGEYCYSIWVYPEPNQTQTIISWLIDYGDKFYVPFGISMLGKKLQLSEIFGGDGKRASLKSDQEIEFNKWHHVVAIKEGNQLKLYINGKFDSSLTLNKETFGRPAYSFYIGAEPDVNLKAVNNWFKGKIDNLKIYSYPLSEYEIQSLYKETLDTLADDESKLPIIEMRNPKVGQDSTFTTFENKIILSGIIKDELGIREVQINGEAVAYDLADFTFDSEKINLKEGINPIKITAINGAEKKAEYSFIIERKSTGIKIRPASTEKRLALVIGNNNYTSSQVLSNPINDVNLIAKELKELDFEVFSIIDGTLDSMQNGIRKYGDLLKNDKNTMGLFYYSGHGMQIKGENFLIPVNANCLSDADVKYRCINLDYLLDIINESKNDMNIVILDACRSNPFVKGWKKGKDASGYAPPTQSPLGTIIAYATTGGTTADDGSGKNGPYAIEFVKAIKNRDSDNDGIEDSVSDVFTTVVKNVRANSNGEQVPNTYSNFEGKFYFHRK